MLPSSLPKDPKIPIYEDIATFALFSRYKSSPNISPHFCQYGRVLLHLNREKGARTGRGHATGKKGASTRNKKGINKIGKKGEREKVGEMNKGPDTEKRGNIPDALRWDRQALAITVWIFAKLSPNLSCLLLFIYSCSTVSFSISYRLFASSSRVWDAVLQPVFS